METKILYDIVISPSSIVRIDIHEHEDKKGEMKKYFTFRFWNLKADGKFHPNKYVGLTLEFQYWGEFYRAFQALKQEIIDNHIDEV
ncbi:hypothetical protein CCP1ISM_50040 [Azospirillaceae bacterium]